MAVGLIFGNGGAGKTVNSIRVNTEKRTLLLNSDFSARNLLNNFPQYTKNVDVEFVEHWMSKDLQGNPQEHFEQQFLNAVNSGKYSCIVVDNLHNLFTLGIGEMDKFPKHDNRRDYQIMYMQIKDLLRQANSFSCDVLFTTWENWNEFVKPSGEIVKRCEPKIQPKILDDVCGLCQVVGKVEHTQDGKYFYDYRNSDVLYAKDQLFLRKTGLPENIFDGGDKKE